MKITMVRNLVTSPSLSLPTSSSSSVILLSVTFAIGLVVRWESFAITVKYDGGKDFVFHNKRQGEFANSLSDYEISIPARVDKDGRWISHSVTHNMDRSSMNRHRRSAVMTPKTSTNNMTSPDDSESHGGDEIHFKVTVEGKEVQLNLVPNDRLFIPGGLVIERRRGGNVTNVSLRSLDLNRCHFVGHVDGHQLATSASISTCNGLHGLISIDGRDYFIEPVKDHTNTADQGHPHLIYRRSATPQKYSPESPLATSTHPSSPAPQDVQCPITGQAPERPLPDDDSQQIETAGISLTTPSPTQYNEPSLRKKREPLTSQQGSSVHPSGSGGRRRKRSVSLEQNVETLVVADKKMIEYYKDEDLGTYILTIMNMVSKMFHDATIGNAINIVLVRIIYLEDDEKELKIGHHAENTLASFCKWQMTINPGDDQHANHHDVAVLLTRVNICSRMNEPCSTLGLAQVSGMCQPKRSCNINEDTGLTLAFTVAHELGHNFGMQHDTADNGCEPKSEDGLLYVMSAQLLAEAGPLVWSNCSRRSITAFLDRDWGYCLKDQPTEHPFTFSDLPPGVMYSIDHQCRLMYGPDAEYCYGIDDLCTTVWCRVDRKCVTRLEAAAEGTLCGENQWCFGGRCVAIGEKPLAIDSHWGEWGAWSECSRTCGAGLSQSERLCNNPPPSHGGRYCLGERKRYRICNTNNCAGGSPSYRDHQCAEFNHIPYKGTTHEWESVATPDTPCQLHCRPQGKRFSVMLRDMVADGTPCYPDPPRRRDMCISGRCRSVGCDWVIQSDAREDNCGVCHGDGSTCQTIKQNFNKESGLGYVEATVIPEGARNIRIEEVAEANNYLAIRNDKGEFYLNGHWFIQWSGDYKAAGTVMQYRREGNKETLVAPGPITEPLHIMLLFQSQNPGVKLEYTIPSENITERRRPEFTWKFMDWTHCTSSCGGGSQISEVVCFEKEAGVVDDVYCENISPKYDNMVKSCNVHQCPARWWFGPWQHCSVSCGDEGTHKRTVLCVRQLSPDEHVALEDWECDGLLKPEVIAPCRHKEPCPVDDLYWQTGPWSDVCRDDPCGIQTRVVTCSSTNLDCDLTTKPVTERVCSNITTCGQWMTGDWSQCTVSCSGGVRGRMVWCAGGTVCRRDLKPQDIQDCNKQPCSLSYPSSSSSYHTSSAYYIASNVTDTVTTSATAADVIRNTSPEISSENDKQMTSTPNLKNNLSPPAFKSATNVPTVIPFHTTTTLITTTTIAATTVENRNQKGVGVGTAQFSTQTMRSTRAPRNSSDYRWMSLLWNECTRSCGGGKRRRDVMCIQMKSMEAANDIHCSSHMKPSTEENCSTERCLPWTVSPWTSCSRTCGEGVEIRQVSCDFFNKCDVDDKPDERRICQLSRCVRWTNTEWQQCSSTCGDGIQTREVRCVDDVTQETAVGCNVAQRPSSTQKCNENAPSCPVEQQTAGLHEKHHGRQQVSSKCTANLMSDETCRVLHRMNKCRQEYVQRKCCVTCKTNQLQTMSTNTR